MLACSLSSNTSSKRGFCRFNLFPITSPSLSARTKISILVSHSIDLRRTSYPTISRPRRTAARFSVTTPRVPFVRICWALTPKGQLCALHAMQRFSNDRLAITTSKPLPKEGQFVMQHSRQRRQQPCHYLLYTQSLPVMPPHLQAAQAACTAHVVEHRRARRPNGTSQTCCDGGKGKATREGGTHKIADLFCREGTTGDEGAPKAGVYIPGTHGMSQSHPHVTSMDVGRTCVVFLGLRW